MSEFWNDDVEPTVEAVEPVSTDEVLVEQDEVTIAEQEATDKPEVRKYKVKVDQEEIEVDEDELLKGYSRHSDYTRKSQSLSEERKAIEAQRIEIEQLRTKVIEDDNDTLVQKAQLQEVKKILNQSKDIDWTTWFSTNPAQATQAFAEYNQYKALDEQLSVSLQSKEQEKGKLAEQTYLQELQKAKQKVYEEVPDFDAIKGKLAKTGNKLGFSNQELDAITDYRMVKVLKDAMQWQEYQETKTTKQKQTPEVTSGKNKLVGNTSKLDDALSKLF